MRQHPAASHDFPHSDADSVGRGIALTFSNGHPSAGQAGLSFGIVIPGQRPSLA